MKDLCYIDILALYDSSREARKKFPSAMAWFSAMETKIGPQRAAPGGYLIRSRQGTSIGMFLMFDEMSWTSLPENGRRFTWGETAIKLTNNPTLEAIQINFLDIAVDCKGVTVAHLPQAQNRLTVA